MIVQVLAPVLMRGMDFYCCGSIPGQGPHRARKAIEKWLEKDPKGTKYAAELDIKKFYPSLSPREVMRFLRRKIKDEAFLGLIWRIIKDGIKIGFYISQWLANAVLEPLDHYIREKLGDGVRHYVRYIDNLTIFGPNKKKLHRAIRAIMEFLGRMGLRLKENWQLYNTRKRMVNAVGYRYKRGLTLIRKKNLLRLKRQCTRARKRIAAHRRIAPIQARGILSRSGQLKHCAGWSLYDKHVRPIEKTIKECRPGGGAKGENIMLEYMIGTTRRNGKSLRYLRIKSDAEIGLTGDLVTFTQTQEDKVSVYEVIVGDLLREESGDGLFYRWYEVESVLVETDHTPQLAAEVEDMAPATVAASIAFVTMAEAGQIDDATAAENASQFAEWAYPVAYKTGAIRRHEGRLYRCVQDHTSQENWTPDAAASLWAEIADPSEEGRSGPSPSGPMTHIAPGPRSPHSEKKWTSDLDNNVWEPGVYGWTEVKDLDVMTVAELKEYASENGIALTGLTLKADILAAIKTAEGVTA